MRRRRRIREATTGPHLSAALVLAAVPLKHRVGSHERLHEEGEDKGCERADAHRYHQRAGQRERPCQVAPEIVVFPGGVARDLGAGNEREFS